MSAPREQDEPVLKMSDVYCYFPTYDLCFYLSFGMGFRHNENDSPFFLRLSSSFGIFLIKYCLLSSNFTSLRLSALNCFSLFRSCIRYSLLRHKFLFYVNKNSLNIEDEIVAPHVIQVDCWVRHDEIWCCFSFRNVCSKYDELLLLSSLRAMT